MTSVFTPALNLEEPGLGDYNNSWNTPLNSNFSIIDQKFGNGSPVDLSSGPVTLTNVQAAYWGLNVTGALSGAQNLIFPPGISGTWVIFNSTTGGHPITVKGSSGDAGYSIPSAEYRVVNCSGGSAYQLILGSEVITALGYTPANKAGDTFTGPVTFDDATTFGAALLCGGHRVENIANPSAATDAVNLQTLQGFAQAPQVTAYTSGSGNYTPPTGALYLEVEALGGGSGGGGSGSGSPGVGAAGGDSTFGGLTAGGAPATPSNSTTTYPTPASASGGDINIPGALGGGAGNLNIGTVGGTGFSANGASSIYGGGGQGTSGAGLVAAANATGYGAGGGGGGYSLNASYNNGWGGNAGAYLKKVVASPSGTYAYSVGGPGSGGTAGTNGAAGGNGSGGIIIVTAHFQ